MQLSVIVPAFNVESWIERCLLSIVHQDISPESYEVIVINDGSPDQSASIAKELAKTFSQIVVIDQENKGLSGARNTGIQNAKGKYVLFIDSDDYIEPNVFSKMLFFAENNDLEIAMFGQNLVINGEQKPRDKFNPTETEVMSGIELFFRRTSDSACKYLIQTEYLKKYDLYFLEKALYLEDGEWSARLFARAQRTAYKGIYFYNYAIRENSIVTSGSAFSKKALIGYIDAAKNLKKFQTNEILKENEKYFINQTIAKFVLLPISLSANKENFSKISFIKSTIRKAGFSKLDERGVVGLRLKHAKLYNKSVNLLFIYLLVNNVFKSIRNRF